MNNSTTAPGTEALSKAFLQNLRDRTAAAHDALEAHPYSLSITSPDITTAAYIRYLQVMQQVVIGFEAALDERLREIVPDIHQRKKAAWIRQDLDSLAATNSDLKPFHFGNGNESIPFALGAYYVIEGSSLGGRVILKSLPKTLLAPDGAGGRYFVGYGSETGSMWQRFLQSFSAYAVATQTEPEIIAGAESAFGAILDYFQTCEGDEAEGYRKS